MLLGYTPKLGDIVRLTPAIHYDKNGGSFRESFKYAEEGDLACRISC